MLSTHLVCWTLALVAIASTTTTAAFIRTTTTIPITTSTTTTAPPPRRLSPTIVDELKDFLDLIPKATVDELVAKHYVLDGNFRKALQYLRSSAFRQLMQEVQSLPEVVEVLEFLHLLETVEEQKEEVESSSTSSNEIVDWTRWQLKMALATNRLPLRFELLPDDDDVRSDTGVVQTNRRPQSLRSFVSFVEELLQHLPRARYVQMIDEKRARNASFASFYASLRSPDFAPLVEATMKSANLVKPLRTLSSNNVDAWSLKPIAFEVISWGPSP